MEVGDGIGRKDPWNLGFLICDFKAERAEGFIDNLQNRREAWGFGHEGTEEIVSREGAKDAKVKPGRTQSHPVAPGRTRSHQKLGATQGRQVKSGG